MQCNFRNKFYSLLWLGLRTFKVSSFLGPNRNRFCDLENTFRYHGNL
jgi:hypothetical protein